MGHCSWPKNTPRPLCRLSETRKRRRISVQEGRQTSTPPAALILEALASLAPDLPVVRWPQSHEDQGAFRGNLFAQKQRRCSPGKFFANIKSTATAARRGCRCCRQRQSIDDVAVVVVASFAQSRELKTKRNSVDWAAISLF